MRRGVFTIGLVLGLACCGSVAQAKSKREVRRHFQAMALVAPSPIALDLGIEVPPEIVGLVSWYGPGFHGRRTASGERYNMNAMTCASRHLPFGTVLEITNLDNGEKAVVRVNDRGPFYRHRILDLSLAAAKKLRFHRKGQTKVAVREISVDTEGPNR